MRVLERNTVAVVLLAITVAGCTRTYWTKPGFNQADWNRDSYECERDMRQSGYYGAGLVGVINAENFQERCLVAKGYHKVTGSTASAPVSLDPYNPGSNSICGEPGTPCCSGSLCNGSDMVCWGGTCWYCGFVADTPCCPGNLCKGSDLVCDTSPAAAVNGSAICRHPNEAAP